MGYVYIVASEIITKSVKKMSRECAEWLDCSGS